MTKYRQQWQITDGVKIKKKTTHRSAEELDKSGSFRIISSEMAIGSSSWFSSSRLMSFDFITPRRVYSKMIAGGWYRRQNFFRPILKYELILKSIPLALPFVPRHFPFNTVLTDRLYSNFKWPVHLSITEAGPGPIASTVFDPGAIWVRPASLITQKLRESDIANPRIDSISSSVGTLGIHFNCYRVKF